MADFFSAGLFQLYGLGRYTELAERAWCGVSNGMLGSLDVLCAMRVRVPPCHACARVGSESHGHEESGHMALLSQLSAFEHCTASIRNRAFRPK